MMTVALLFILLTLAMLGTWVASAVAWPALMRVHARAIPVALTALLALGGALALAAVLPVHGTQCHCQVDDPSVVHICALHPERALPFVPFALAVLALLLVRPTLAALRLTRGLRATRAVLRASRSGNHEDARLLLTEAPIRNAFAVLFGKGGIVVDRAWWATLEDWERRAVIAHEKAHLRRRDPAMLTLLSVAASLLPPWLGPSVLDRWRLWAEQSADAAAASEIGDAEAVADLLVRQHRPADARLAATTALSNACSLEHRVDALLHGGRDVDEAPPGFLMPVLAIAAAGIAAWFAAPAVHHVTESIIAWVR